MTPLRVYIGYDPREDTAWRVAGASLARRATIDLSIQGLAVDDLQARGLFWRKWHTEQGRMVDDIDGRPFSTQFAFSRFLVPAICRQDGFHGWALFVDCDVLFTRDIGELLPLLDPGKALMCVQHRQQVVEGSTKMDGQVQTSYPRKNWSSFMVFNLADPAHDALTVSAVNAATGAWLHGLTWLRDDQIGGLPTEWNWLEGYSEPRAPNDPPAVIHYTRGGPWFPGYEDVAFADRWRLEAQRLMGD